MAFWILQISDLHFGPMSHWHQFDPVDASEKFFEEIRNALANAGVVQNFDVVLLSGDFSWGPFFQDKAKYELGFKTAAELVKILLQNNYCLPKGLMLLPGNHDIVWSPKIGGPLHLRQVAEGCFRNFVQEIFPGQPERLGEHLGHFELFQHPEREYLFLTLNSSRIEARERAGTGYVGYSQVYDLLKRASEKAPRENKTYFGIAALHHHLLPVEAVRLNAVVDNERSHQSYVTDGIDILEALLQAGFSLALHGHLHMPSHYVYTQAVDGAEPVSLTVSCAGSFGIGLHSKNISRPHQFQAIEIGQHFIRFHSFEAPLREAGRTRQWTERVLEFPLPETFNRRSPKHRVYLWQLADKRLSSRRVNRSLHEFALFEDCLLLGALNSGDDSAVAKLRAAIKKREAELKSQARKDFDRAFEYAIARLREKSVVDEFHNGFESDDPWNLEERLISFMNDWEGVLSASGQHG